MSRTVSLMVGLKESFSCWIIWKCTDFQEVSPPGTVSIPWSYVVTCSFTQKDSSEYIGPLTLFTGIVRDWPLINDVECRQSRCAAARLAVQDAGE